MNSMTSKIYNSNFEYVFFPDLVMFLDEKEIKDKLSNFVGSLQNRLDYLKLDIKEISVNSLSDLLEKSKSLLKESYIHYVPPGNNTALATIYNTQTVVAHMRISFLEKILEKLSDSFLLKEDTILSIDWILLNNLVLFKETDVYTSKNIIEEFTSRIKEEDIRKMDFEKPKKLKLIL
jgi:hypothetical protein